MHGTRPSPSLHTEARRHSPRTPPQACHLGLGTRLALPGMLSEAERKSAQLPQGIK